MNTKLPTLKRRTLLAAMAGTGLSWALRPSPSSAAERFTHNDRAYSSYANIRYLLKPKSVAELGDVLKSQKGKLSIYGAGYSQGGQVHADDATLIDMRALREVIAIDTEAKTITVQAGSTWRELQAHIDPLGLSVTTMQSFANFSVGGAISVNCHGRYVNAGGLIHSLLSLTLMLSDGRLVVANRQENRELFFAVVGGYGALAIIIEATLQLRDNLKIAREVVQSTLEQYPNYFQQTIANSQRYVLHNADLSPPNFDTPLCINYLASEKPLTKTQRLSEYKRSYPLQNTAFWLEAELGPKNKLREWLIDPALKFDKVVWLNHEASLDLNALGKNREGDYLFALQEYFVPVEHFQAFVQKMTDVFRGHGASIINVSTRHVKADRETLLTWAPEDSFCFVVYFRQDLNAESINRTKLWVQDLIDEALALGGRFYLPYQLFATQSQVDQAYPGLARLRALKKQYDPKARLTNKMWQMYL